MLYKKYYLYENGLELMVPSDLKPAKAAVSSQYSWVSEDESTLLNVAKGGGGLSEKGLEIRLNEFCKGFERDIPEFQCVRMGRRGINGYTYGEIRYTSRMTEYPFFNIFLLGEYGERELIVTLQRMGGSPPGNIHVLENVIDSLRLLKGAAFEEESGSTKSFTSTLRLLYSGNSGHLTFEVGDRDFLIGRDDAEADGVISRKLSKAVSRKHCLITRLQDKYFVQDLKSVNHTLVNGIMIPPYELMELEENDILSVADIEFRIKRG